MKETYRIQDLFKYEFINKEVANIIDGEKFIVKKESGYYVLRTKKSNINIEAIYTLNELLNIRFALVEKEEVKLKGYLANGLFSLGDRLVNELVATKVREIKGIDLYVPQENMAINDKQAYASSEQIYKGDYDYLKETGFVIAIIDGVEVDSGVAAEIGIASAMHKKIYALYTDSRQQGTENTQKINALVNDATENQFMYRNLFIIGLIKNNGYIFNNIEDLVNQLKEDMRML